MRRFSTVGELSSSLHSDKLSGLRDDCFDYLNWYIAIKRLECKMPGCIPKNHLSNKSRLSKSLSVQTKTRIAVRVVVDVFGPEAFVAKLLSHS